jgi:transposase-like protein
MKRSRALDAEDDVLSWPIVAVLYPASLDGTGRGVSWMAKLFGERVMSEEVYAVCGAPYGERSEERTNQRNGHRSRAWDTRTLLT